MLLRLGEVFGRRFYFMMAVVVMIITIYGFGQTIDQRLIHPPSPRPVILYVHSVVFAIWMILLLVQTALVQAGNIRLHGFLGMFGLGVGWLLPVVGVWVAIAMSRFNIARGDAGQEAALLYPFFDMALFAVLFGFAIHWRDNPPCHKRLMFLAAASLTVAAFARFPHFLVPRGLFNLGFDALVFIAVVRDRIIEKRIHKVYLVCLPLIVLGQFATEIVRRTPWWIGVANEILR